MVHWLQGLQRVRTFNRQFFHTTRLNATRPSVVSLLIMIDCAHSTTQPQKMPKMTKRQNKLAPKSPTWYSICERWNIRHLIVLTIICCAPNRKFLIQIKETMSISLPFSYIWLSLVPCHLGRFSGVYISGGCKSTTF